MPRAHFVGIGGAGMSALARVLMEMGYEVTGSDLVLGEAARRLAGRGARVFQGHRAEQVGNPDLVVVSAAVPADNVEVREARARGLPVLGRAELLARLMAERDGVGVAGAHGKTTTASMVAVCLERAGLDPTVLIGGELNDEGATSRLGRGRYLVAEVDEYDGTILLLHPHVALVTNIDDDHLERYRYSMDELVGAFRRFLDQVRPGGTAVACLDSPHLRRALEGYRGNLITYSLNGEADYTAADIGLLPGGSRFVAHHGGRPLGEVTLAVPGLHNVQNALGAIAACSFLGVDFPVAREALASFRGVRRRFQTLGTENGIRVVDDFAHHPAEVEATLRAARLEAGGGRVVCLFQPHRYTRTQILHRAFGPALALADLVGVMDVYPAAEPPLPGVTGELVARAVRDQGKPAPFLPSPREALDWLRENVRPGDLVMVMGAGDIWKVGKEFVRHLRGGGASGTGPDPAA
ncbi:MAG: UDP-N-acetylmuramate--L-alanine ligase [Bacillota bacterium]|nr:UDP-N-acetylmuramate--L-alanine ligase [Bacillota bacterium]